MAICNTLIDNLNLPQSSDVALRLGVMSIKRRLPFAILLIFVVLSVNDFTVNELGTV